MPRARIKVEVSPAHTQLRVSSRRAFVGISLNNQTMASADLLRMIFDWTVQNVGNFDLLVGDYLNRYNYQAFDGETEIAAAEKARLAGDEARNRLGPLVSSGGPYRSARLISTATLCEHPSFEDRRSHFRRYYFENAEFRRAIEQGVDAFLTRRHPHAVSDTAVRDYCVAYQLEELVMFEQLAKEGYGVFVYPGAQLPIMKSLVSGELPGVSTELENLVLIELRIFEDTMR